VKESTFGRGQLSDQVDHHRVNHYFDLSIENNQKIKNLTAVVESILCKTAGGNLGKNVDQDCDEEGRPPPLPSKKDIQEAIDLFDQAVENDLNFFKSLEDIR
jgi:hypothetical protein